MVEYKFPAARNDAPIRVECRVTLYFSPSRYRIAVDTVSGIRWNNFWPIMAELEAAFELNQDSSQPRGRLVHFFFL